MLPPFPQSNRPIRNKRRADALRKAVSRSFPSVAPVSDDAPPVRAAALAPGERRIKPRVQPRLFAPQRS